MQRASILQNQNAKSIIKIIVKTGIVKICKKFKKEKYLYFMTIDSRFDIR